MHLGVGGPLQPLQAASVEDAIVHIQPVAEEIPLDVLHHILNFSFAFWVRPAAHTDGQPAFLPELLKLIGVDDVPGIFTYAYDTVLVEYQFLRHPAHVLEAVMADPYKVYAGKGPVLLLRVLVPRPGQYKRRHIHLGLPAVHVGHHLLSEIHLHLFPHRQLRHRLILSRRRALFQPVFFPYLLHIPGYCSLAHLLPVVFPQPVAYLGRCQVWKFPQPLQNPRLVLVQVLHPADCAAHFLVLVYRHFPIPLYCLAVDSKLPRHLPLAESRRTKLLNLAIHAIPLHSFLASIRVSVLSFYQMAASGFCGILRDGIWPLLWRGFVSFQWRILVHFILLFTFSY